VVLLGLVHSRHSITPTRVSKQLNVEREITEHELEVEERIETAPPIDTPESARRKKIRKVRSLLITTPCFAKRNKQVSTGSVNTIEANIEALNAKKLDSAFLVDPLFRKTSAAFDQGGVKGLLLNHLEVGRGCTLVFDSVDVVDFSDKVEDTQDTDCCIEELYGKSSGWLMRGN
jgi:hypothetical protein